MLRKLLKHEFRATGRVMVPVIAILLATSLGANLSLRYLMDSRAWFLSMLGLLLITAFGLAIVGVFIVAFILMIQRFYKNLLQDEGYVMLTLPVSIHQHIWSKLIASSVWFILTTLAVILASCIVAFNIAFIKDLFQGLGMLFRELREVRPVYAFNGAAFLVELAALLFLGLVAMCLQFYAALAAGHSFPNHKMVLSVAWFFGLQFAFQLLSVSALEVLDRLNFFAFFDHFYFSDHNMAGIHLGILFMIVLTVIYGGIFYIITTLFMKRRLNLE